LPTNSLIQKSGKFHYVIYRIDKIDKIALLLVVATQQL